MPGALRDDDEFASAEWCRSFPSSERNGDGRLTVDDHHDLVARGVVLPLAAARPVSDEDRPVARIREWLANAPADSSAEGRRSVGQELSSAIASSMEIGSASYQASPHVRAPGSCVGLSNARRVKRSGRAAPNVQSGTRPPPPVGLVDRRSPRPSMSASWQRPPPPTPPATSPRPAPRTRCRSAGELGVDRREDDRIVGPHRRRRSGARPFRRVATRNFSKFHRMSGSSLGVMPKPAQPLTDRLGVAFGGRDGGGQRRVQRMLVVADDADLGEHRELHRVVASRRTRRSRRSCRAPGRRSCWPGTRAPRSPWFAGALRTASRAARTGRQPHFDATLTMSRTVPA